MTTIHPLPQLLHGFGCKMFLSSPSALETRKKSWKWRGCGAKYPAASSMVCAHSQVCWLSSNTPQPLGQVLGWHVHSALSIWPALGGHPAKTSPAKTPRPLAAVPIPFGLSENTIPFPNHSQCTFHWSIQMFIILYCLQIHDH